MCAKAMRAASPRGHRHGFDESVSAISCLNDAFTGVGGLHTLAHTHAPWGGGILEQRGAITIWTCLGGKGCSHSEETVLNQQLYKDLQRVQWFFKEC